MASALVLLLASCHSKKTITTAEREVTSTAEVSALRTETAFAASMLRSLSAQLDSVEVIIEPVACDTLSRQPLADCLGTRPAPAARLRLRAKTIRLDDNKVADITGDRQTLQTDSMECSGQSVAETVEASDTVVGYEPPNLVWLFGLALVLLSVAFALIRHIRK